MMLNRLGLLGAALLMLSACDVPAPTPEGAVPFTAVLAQNEGRPYECSNYDARTNTCTGLSRYQDLGGGRYQFLTTSRVDPDMPALRIEGILEVRGAQVCFLNDTVEVSSTAGVQDASMEIMFAQFESFLRSLEPVCAVYSSNEGGYETTIVQGPDFAIADPTNTVQFFAQAKRLRYEP